MYKALNNKFINDLYIKEIYIDTRPYLKTKLKVV
jgi:hypothetical protein